jgi:hypothetical protein
MGKQLLKAAQIQNGLPAGGSAGQLLLKNSSTDYDAVWSSSLTLSGAIAGSNLNSGSPFTTGYHDSFKMATDEQLHLRGPLVPFEIRNSLTYFSGGNVGIRNSAPTYDLDITAGNATNARVALRLRNGTASDNVQLRFMGNSSAVDKWAIGNAVATDDTATAFDFYDLQSGVNRMRIMAGVYVGGTTDPGAGSLQVANRFIGKGVTVTYSSSITIDASLGNIFVITATNSTAFTINAPTNPVSWQEIVITIKAPVGADTGAITWSTAATGFKKTTSSGVVSNTRDSYRFYYDGSNWVEIGLFTGVPN